MVSLVRDIEGAPCSIAASLDDANAATPPLRTERKAVATQNRWTSLRQGCHFNISNKMLAVWVLKRCPDRRVGAHPSAPLRQCLRSSPCLTAADHYGTAQHPYGRDREDDGVWSLRSLRLWLGVYNKRAT
jgi:hypothetical protein